MDRSDWVLDDLELRGEPVRVFKDLGLSPGCVLPVSEYKVRLDVANIAAMLRRPDWVPAACVARAVEWGRVPHERRAGGRLVVDPRHIDWLLDETVGLVDRLNMRVHPVGEEDWSCNEKHCAARFSMCVLRHGPCLSLSSSCASAECGGPDE